MISFKNKGPLISSMRVLEINKEGVMNKAGKMSDFLRMEYLELCSGSIGDKEVLIYCYSELAKLYEEWFMYPEALKYLAKLKSLTLSNKEKLKIYEKEIEVFIKSGNYDKVLNHYKEAVKIIGKIEEFELRRSIIQFYREEATKLELKKKYASMSRLYERLIPFLTDYEI